MTNVTVETAVDLLFTTGTIEVHLLNTGLMVEVENGDMDSVVGFGEVVSEAVVSSVNVLPSGTVVIKAVSPAYTINNETLAAY